MIEDILLDQYYNAFDNENYIIALKILKKIKPIQQDSAWVYAKIGECYYELKKYKIAVKYCNKSLAVQEKYPLPLWILGNSFYYLKQYNDSVDVFLEVINLSEYDIGKRETRLGISWAKSLKMDCYLKVADNFYMMEKDIDAQNYFQKFRLIKKKRVKSCLPNSYIKSIRRKMKEISH
jgi:tetratricopeptide (TPR) repeat protein